MKLEALLQLPAAVTIDEVAVTPPANTTYRVYYYAGGKPIAMRVLPPNDGTGTLYYLHSDHLGSTSVTTCGNTTAPCTTVGSVFARQRYYPYGEIRPGGTGTMPTTIGYTGQRRDDIGLMFFRARYYSSALGRFVSADSIVPEPGNPQALNRYAYVYNSPLKYIDPSGHDVMIVPGFTANAYADPKDWEIWVRYYKGWDRDQWLDYYDQWMNADDAGKQALMTKHGVYYYRWANDDSAGTVVSDAAVAELHRQMSGMQDITLIGHSKGANLVQNYLAAYGSEGTKSVLIKAPNEPYISASGSREPGAPFALQNCWLGVCTGPRSYSGNGTVVNIHGTPDHGGGSAAIDGTVNFPSNDDQAGIPIVGPYTNHGNAPNLAMAAYYALNVSNDHGSGFRVFAGGPR